MRRLQNILDIDQFAALMSEGKKAPTHLAGMTVC